MLTISRICLKWTLRKNEVIDMLELYGIKGQDIENEECDI